MYVQTYIYVLYIFSFLNTSKIVKNISITIHCNYYNTIRISQQIADVLTYLHTYNELCSKERKKIF